MLETWQPTGTASAFSYTKLAPPCPQLARTLDELGDAFDDEGERLPPPVGSVEGLLEDGGEEGLSVGDGPEEGTESGEGEGDSVEGVTGVSPVGAGEGIELGAASAGEGVEGREPGVSPVGAGEGIGLGAASAGEGEEGKVLGVEGISPAPPGVGAEGVPAGESTVGDPPPV